MNLSVTMQPDTDILTIDDFGNIDEIPGREELTTAYRKLNNKIKAVKFHKEMAIEREKFFVEERRRLENVLQKMNAVAEKIVILPPPPLACHDYVCPTSSEWKYQPQQYILNDQAKNHYVIITMEEYQYHSNYMTIKKILRQMKPMMQEYSNCIPLKLFQYVTKNILEQQLNDILYTCKQDLNCQELLTLYREHNPFEDDENFVEKTMLAILNGHYNDLEKYNPEEGSSGELGAWQLVNPGDVDAKKLTEPWLAGKKTQNTIESEEMSVDGAGSSAGSPGTSSKN